MPGVRLKEFCAYTLIMLFASFNTEAGAGPSGSYPISISDRDASDSPLKEMRSAMMAPSVHPLPAVSSSTQGMVSASHPQASAAGVEMLAKGGNAADAAVAMGFMLSVIEPEMSGIGGRCQILLHTADGELKGIDAQTQIPAEYKNSDKPVKSGHQITGIPGMVAGLLLLHETQGSLPIGDILAPAIKLAEEGMYILPKTLYFWSTQIHELNRWDGSRETFLKTDGTLYGIDEPYAPAAQGEVLRRIVSNGFDGFYRGDTANLIVADQRKHGGPISLQDLAEYKTRDAQLLRFGYRDVELVTMAAPAGGSIVARILTLMEQFDLHSANEAMWARIVSQATAVAVNAWELDKEDRELPEVLNKTWAQQQAKQLYDLNHERPQDRHLTATALKVNMGVESVSAGEHTTHFIAADKSGMVVSITQSNGLILGSKVVPKGTGFILAQVGGRGGENLAAGERPRTAISPTMILRNGKPLLMIGAAGSVRIPSAIAQVVSRVIDRGMDIDAALKAPRIMPMSLSRGEKAPLNEFDIESNATQKWNTDVIGALEGMGFDVNVIDWYGYFAIVNAIKIDPVSGKMIGAAEPDWHGAALGPEYLDQ